MLQLARRALDDAPTVIRHNPAADVSRNTFVSAFAPVAIYFGSYASLKLWRALQTYDLLTKDAPKRAPAPTRRWAIALWLLVFFGLEGSFIYSIVTENSPAVHIGIMVLNGLVALSAFTWMFIGAVSDTMVSRVAGKKVDMYIVRTIKVHRKRSFIAAFAALGLAAYKVMYPSESLYFAMIGGLIYRLVSRPALMSKGWISVRGMVIAMSIIVAFMITSVSGLVFAIVKNGNLAAITEEPLPKSGIQEELEAYDRISNHFLNVVTGTIIAAVLRYESTAARSAIQLPIEDTEETIPVSKEVIDEPAPVDTKITVPITNVPSFPAPLFHLCLAVLFAVHVPAIVLSLPRFQYLYTSPDASSMSLSLLFAVLATVPPQLWGLIAVPAVIAAATHIRGDGKDLWRYAEQWVIVHKKEKKTAAPAVEAVEAQALVDTKA